MIRFACPSCKAVIKAPDDKGGIKSRCPSCKASVEIPVPRGQLLDEPVRAVQQKQPEPAVLEVVRALEGAALASPENLEDIKSKLGTAHSDTAYKALDHLNEIHGKTRRAGEAGQPAQPEAKQPKAAKPAPAWEAATHRNEETDKAADKQFKTNNRRIAAIDKEMALTVKAAQSQGKVGTPEFQKKIEKLNAEYKATAAQNQKLKEYASKPKERQPGEDDIDDDFPSSQPQPAANRVTKPGRAASHLMPKEWKARAAEHGIEPDHLEAAAQQTIKADREYVREVNEMLQHVRETAAKYPQTYGDMTRKSKEGREGRMEEIRGLDEMAMNAASHRPTPT